jgi:hypothetical protein
MNPGKKSMESVLKRVASGEVDAAVGATLVSGSHQARAAERDLAEQRAFVRAEVVDLQVDPDDSRVVLRLAVSPDAIDLRSTDMPLLQSLALNGAPVHDLRIQAPRSAVDSMGRPSFEFSLSGRIERTLARDLRSTTALSIEGVLTDGRFLAALKGG